MLLTPHSRSLFSQTWDEEFSLLAFHVQGNYCLKRLLMLGYPLNRKRAIRTPLHRPKRCVLPLHYVLVVTSTIVGSQRPSYTEGIIPVLE